MWKDPIVEEVRKVREKLWKEANYDVHTYFENAEKAVERIEKEYGIKWKKVTRVNNKCNMKINNLYRHLKAMEKIVDMRFPYFGEYIPEAEISDEEREELHELLKEWKR
jgi:sulfatase maturation enzyme AslB (radical SAM superfamily)